ncbi:hypothetical protein BDQ17DRAFT_1294681 [Cyathus striatus]|nr:hypothetical protein BDQ17DRAFT_1294681 [Cyathus striatus]
MTSIPKAVLYYSPRSVWSAVARLAIEEKGYGKDELDLRIVDLVKGENYSPTFLRLNSKATVPTLVVPLDKTLSEDIESRYQSITESKAIVEFIDKSRSAVSRTNTTSSAPAPSLTPATIAGATTARIIIEDILHSPEADPTKLYFINARTDASLAELAKQAVPILKGKQESLSSYISGAQNDTIHVSDKVQNLWKEKKSAADTLLEVLSEGDKSTGQLSVEANEKRRQFFKAAQDAWEVDVKAILTRLSKEMSGPFALGDQFSLADLHLAAWLSRIVNLAGGNASDDGNVVVRRLEEYIGNGFTLPKDFTTSERRDGDRGSQSKLAAFWDAVTERQSWKTVYGSGLF